MLKMATAVFATLLLSLCAFFSYPISAAEKNEKRYRVELVVFKTRGNTSDEAIELGRPSLKEALPFAPLPKEKLVLNDAKQKLARRYPSILHTAWLQTIGTKENPTVVHVIGGRELANGVREIEGLVQIHPGKQILVETDLAIFNTDGDSSTPTQVGRLQTTNPVSMDEINYINHSGYSMILMVTPEVTRRI